MGEHLDSVESYRAVRRIDYCTDALLNKYTVIDSLHRYFYGHADGFNKTNWLKRTGTTATPGMGNTGRVDLWFFASNVSFDAALGSEHTGYLKTTTGWKNIGPLVKIGEDGSSTTRGFLISNVNIENRSEPGQTLSLRIDNNGGGSTSSTLTFTRARPSRSC